MAGVPAGRIAERRVIDRLMRANAVSPSSAHAMDGLRWIEARRLRHLMRAAVVLEAQPGLYYLDVPALADHLAMHRRTAMIAIMFVVLLMAALAYFAETAAGR